MRFLLGILVSFLVCVEASGQKRLTILHVNDTHSHLEPERNGEFMGMGGVIERAAYRDSVVKAEGRRNVLLLHAGDFSQGTSYFSTLEGNIEIDLLNAMEYDCVTLGNHEFDNGLKELARRLSNLDCPVVCANYDFSSTELGPFVKPYAIFRKAGLKVGIIGFAPDLGPLISKAAGVNMVALDNVETARKWADFLKNEEKCDLVIALTHLGFKGGPFMDCDLARESRNIDIIVGGHTHTELKEPCHVKNLDGVMVPIVQDNCWGLTVGDMKVSVDRK